MPLGKDIQRLENEDVFNIICISLPFIAAVRCHILQNLYKWMHKFDARRMSRDHENASKGIEWVKKQYKPLIQPHLFLQQRTVINQFCPEVPLLVPSLNEFRQLPNGLLAPDSS